MNQSPAVMRIYSVSQNGKRTFLRRVNPGGEYRTSAWSGQRYVVIDPSDRVLQNVRLRGGAQTVVVR